MPERLTRGDVHPSERDVVLLFGSPSSEQHVSVASAQHITGDMPGAVHWYWTPDDTVVEIDQADLVGHADPFEKDFRPLPRRSWPSLEGALEALDPQRAVVFLCLHGSPGEDGWVQRLLEDRGVAYTGSDAASSEVAWDKVVAKRRAAAAGLFVAHHVAFAGAEAGDLAGELDGLRASWGGLIVKPVLMGSSLGLRRLTDGDALAAWVREAGAGDPKALYLAEPLVAGREFTVGVLEDVSGPRALPVSEVVTSGGKPFDFAAKYLDPETQEITPARIDRELESLLHGAGVAAHVALGCRGHSRSDFMRAHDGTLVFLETNTLPGLSRASFIPQMLHAAGIPMRRFVELQIRVALRRHAGAGG